MRRYRVPVTVYFDVEFADDGITSLLDQAYDEAKLVISFEFEEISVNSKYIEEISA